MSMALALPTDTRAADAMAPVPYRVVGRARETADTMTLTLEPVGASIARPRPGQFNMLYAFGVGEVPISVSAIDAGHRLRHTIRGVGAVSQQLCAAEAGTMVGVRGPFGNDWGLDSARGSDVLVVAGGIGLAPLRPVVHELLRSRRRYRRVTVLVGPAPRRRSSSAARWRAGRPAPGSPSGPPSTTRPPPGRARSAWCRP